MPFDVQHEPSAHRFTSEVEGVRCRLDYELAERGEATVMTITHTLVPSAVGGRGIAAELVQAALQTARERGWKVVPACSYADAWMRRHPEFSDLRA